LNTSVWVAIRCARHVVAIASLVILVALPAGAADPAISDAKRPPAEAPKNPPSPTAIDVLSGLQAELRRAKAGSDWRAYLAAAKRQAEQLNQSPMSHLEMARAQAHVGDLNAGLAELRAFVQMGQASELLDTLPDLASLRNAPGFAAIRAQAADNLKPVARSSLAFRLKAYGLLPEDMDYDPRSQRFFISSVLRNKIVTATMQGDTADFATSPDGWPVLALRIDHARQLLWASEVAIEGFAGVEKSAHGRSAILCYELRSGKLLRRIEAPRPSALGDIALTPDGAVIASDGEHGAIFRVRRSDDHMERIDAGDFISPQTVALAPDGAHIIVPDYVRGLGLLELETKRVIWLSTQGRYALTGIDGLYRAGRQLIAVQNGTAPERVVIFSLDAAGINVVAENIIERSTATLGDPTHGVVVDDSFYYIANSGWDVLGPDGKVKAGTTLPEPAIMRVALRARPVE
jgi:hypothetical protein